MSQDKDNNEAASASQSSTAGANTEYVSKLRAALYAIANTLDDGELRSAAQAAYDLAHVARQRQESAADTGAASVDTPELRVLMRNYYDTASSFAGSSPADSALLAVFAHIETVYGAQQREAGKRLAHDPVQAEEARLYREFTGDVMKLGFQGLADAVAALAREPVSEGLTEAQCIAVRDAVAESLTGVYYCGRVWSAWGVGTMSEDDFTPAAEDDDVLDSIVDAAVQALSAAPPAKAEGLTDDQLDSAAAQAMDRVAADLGMHALEINSDVSTHHTLRRALVRAGATLTQQAKGEQQ